MAVELLKPGHMLRLTEGMVLPVDVRVLGVRDAGGEMERPYCVADSHQVSGQSSNPYARGDILPQGSRITGDVAVIAEVVRPYHESQLCLLREENLEYKPSERQSQAKRWGNRIMYGGLALTGGTALVSAFRNFYGDRKEEGNWQEKIGRIMEDTLPLAVVAAPCNILVSTMVEGAAVRSLWNQGVTWNHQGHATLTPDVTHYCFDLTGTLTMGLEYDHAVLFDAEGNRLDADATRRAMREVAGLGKIAHATHPLQLALRRALLKREDGLLTSSAESLGEETLAYRVEQLEEELRDHNPESPMEIDGMGIAGFGVRGETLRIGRRNFIEEEGALPGAAADALHAYQRALPDANGGSAFWKSSYIRVGEHWGMVFFKERLREEARQVMQALGPEHVTILTGDTEREAVYSKTDALGIPREQVHAGLLPGQKADPVRALQEQGEMVAMIGDGINDTRAMQAADLSYALTDMMHRGVKATASCFIDDLTAIAAMPNLFRRVNTVSSHSLIGATAYTGGLALYQAANGADSLGTIGGAAAHEGVSALIALAHQTLARGMVEDSFTQEREGIRNGESLPGPREHGPIASAPP